MWHGASWNFIIWGLYFACFLVLEKLFLKKWLDKAPKIIGFIYTFFLVIISFVIFNTNDLNSLMIELKSLFGFNNLVFTNEVTNYYLNSYLGVFVIALFGATPLMKKIIDKLKDQEKGEKIINLLEPIFLLGLLILSTSYLVDGSFNPFIYFRF